MTPWLQIAGPAIVRILISLVMLTGLGGVLLRLAGRLRSSTYPREPFAQVFTFLAVGIAVFVTVFALVTTSGRSILWCVCAAFFGLFAFRDPEVDPVPEPERDPARSRQAVALVAAVAFVVLALWAGIHVLRAGSFPYQVHADVGSDAAYWATVARALPNTGLESGAAFESTLAPGTFAPEPYHYVELWLTAGIAAIWSVPTYLVLFLDVPVIFGMTWIFGVAAMGEAIGARRWRTVVIGLLFLAFAPWLPLAPNTIPPLSGWDVLMTEGAVLGRLSTGRLLPGYILVAASALLALRERPRRALAILGLAPAMNPTLLALPIGGILSFLLLARGQYTAPRRFLRVVLPCAAILVTFWSFYAVHSQMLPPDLLRELLDPDRLRTKIHIIGKSTLQALLVYGPYLALVTAWAPLVRRGLVVAVVVAGTGLLGWVATHALLDSSQFFVNSTVVVANSVLVLGLVALSGGRRRAVALGAIALVAALRWREALHRAHEAPSYSTEYLEGVQREGAGRAGGFVVPDETLKSRSAHALYLRTNIVPYLEPLATARGAVAISDAVPFVREEAWRYRYEDLLYRRYLRRYGVPGEPHVSSCMQEAFVDHYDLDFVILVADAEEPDWLKTREVQRLTDHVSGDRFVLIDKTRRGRRPEDCPYAMERAVTAGRPSP